MRGQRGSDCVVPAIPHWAICVDPWVSFIARAYTVIPDSYPKVRTRHAGTRLLRKRSGLV
jgi:hypothetical protein